MTPTIRKARIELPLFGDGSVWTPEVEYVIDSDTGARRLVSLGYGIPVEKLRLTAEETQVILGRLPKVA